MMQAVIQCRECKAWIEHGGAVAGLVPEHGCTGYPAPRPQGMASQSDRFTDATLARIEDKLDWLIYKVQRREVT